MDPFLSKVECYNVYNTLNCVPFLLINQNTIVDLRNETSVAGRIEHVDGFMNITMNEVVFIDQRGKYHAFDNFMIPARNIKFVHIPEKVDLLSSMQQYFAGKQRISEKKPKRTFKLKRAQQKHLDTLKEIAAQRTQKEPGENN